MFYKFNLTLALVILLFSFTKAQEQRPSEQIQSETLQVTLKYISNEGQTLSEATTYVKRYKNGQFSGTCSINIGNPDAPHYHTVEFDAGPLDSGAEIEFEVADQTSLKQGVSEGRTYILPVYLVDITRPRNKTDHYTVYSTPLKKLIISFQVVDKSQAEASDPIITQGGEYQPATRPGSK